jgi:hypothetical protein
MPTMDLQNAIQLKKEISSSLLSKRARSRVVSMASGSDAKAVTVATKLPAAVNGVGVAERANGKNVIKILTREEAPLNSSSISDFYGVDRTDFIVENVGPIRFKAPVDHHRPPFPGISVGHFRITAGTLGCFVKDPRNSIYVLSNNHVLGNSNTARWNDPILQPGPEDGGRRRDTVANLRYLVDLEFSGPNYMDAALAIIQEGLNPLYPIYNRRAVTGTVDPRNKMRVEKWGRTTGHTVGSVTTSNLDIIVDFDGHELEFLDQFEIKARGRMFCDGGDSGSLILERDTSNAVGLLFAGNDEGTTYATPINEVLTTLNVEIL